MSYSSELHCCTKTVESLGHKSNLFTWPVYGATWKVRGSWSSTVLSNSLNPLAQNRTWTSFFFGATLTNIATLRTMLNRHQWATPLDLDSPSAQSRSWSQSWSRTPLNRKRHQTPTSSSFSHCLQPKLPKYMSAMCNFLFYVVTIMVWLGWEKKNTWLGLGNDHVWVKIPGFVATNIVGSCVKNMVISCIQMLKHRLEFQRFVYRRMSICQVWYVQINASVVCRNTAVSSRDCVVSNLVMYFSCMFLWVCVSDIS